MRLNLVSTLVILAFAAGAAGAAAQPPAPAAAQTPPAKSLYDRYTEPIAIYKNGLGDFTKKISTTNPEAQAYFDQGFQMMYAFAKPEAVRSFREAWKKDPQCAICYWGEAWAWGSYLNGPMRDDEAPHAYAAIQKALELKKHANPKERALIDAMAVRYVEKFDAEKRIEQDRAYRDAIAKVSAQYPDDLEIATLYADALFLLEPRRGKRDVNDPNVQKLHSVLESVLSRDVKHPGACHLYVHATESTVEPGRAEACAAFLGQAIPGASHINHMPSHTWNEVGRWGDSVRANLEAWHSDQKAAIGEGFAIYPEHNLHMLLYAASYDGQGAIATRAGKDYGKLTGETFYEVLTLIRFGRFDEVLEVKNRPTPEIQGGLWDFAQGYAHLKQGHTDFARLYLGAREEGRRDDEGVVPPASGQGPARDRGRHPRRRDPADRRRSSGRDRDVPEGGRDPGRPDVRRAGAAAVCRAPLAGRRAARGQALRRGRTGLSRRPQGASPQRLGAARPEAGARRQGGADRRGPEAARGELVPRRYMDQGVPLLSGVHTDRERERCEA